MRKFTISLVLLVSIIFVLMGSATAQEVPEGGIFFSTEEDFVTYGPKPPDGNPIISDGDLLNSAGYVYARNRELLRAFKVEDDLGLDAADVIDVKDRFVAFSTELDHPDGLFTAGDLLATNGAILPNSALLVAFGIPRELDLGLDAAHFIGEQETIIKFLEVVKEKGRKFWLESPRSLIGYLKEFGIDIWFSTEGTAPKLERPLFLNGDLLSATGTIVFRNADLLPPSVPAGIRDRGVDFGLDAFAADRKGNKEWIYFSTEILYEGEPSFTDGDVLQFGNGVVITNHDLIRAFEPKADFLGLDALSIAVPAPPPLCIQITKVGGISTADIDPVDGLATSEKSPFGQWVTIHGCVPNAPDINPAKYEYRVQYRMDTEATWHPILMRKAVLHSFNPTGWLVTRLHPVFGVCDPPWPFLPHKVERWIEGPDYDGVGGADGWNRLDEYWSDANPCNGDMPLVIWNTMGDGGDPDGRRPDGRYWLRLTVREIGNPATEINSAEVLIVLDNTLPAPMKMELVDVPTGVSLECKVTGTKISISIAGQVRDDHFRYYELYWTGGDNHSWQGIPLTAAESAILPPGRYRWYDSARADLDMQGTEPPAATNVPLGTFNFTQEYQALFGKDPIPCGYTVLLRAWDRTIRGYYFDVKNNKVYDYLGWPTDYLDSFCYAP